MRNNIITFFDCFIAITTLVMLSPILFCIYIIIFFDHGSPIFIQVRMGKNKKPFSLIKFRTMKPDTESVASHLVATSSITPVGRVLRKTKLDELPQLINVLKRDMSLVGPRPNLFNQIDVIKAREEYEIYSVLPGITGLAQVNNIDMSTPIHLAEMDKKMLAGFSIRQYFKYIFMTIFGAGRGDAARP
ncbi:sugar transferase [Motilimonas sp. E26]|uniref:sugar transferase n=1 Tax=Motilimonas sp. E26 TaxID=2865674 RepID=UPI001E5F53DC|nr:sugar transferase [Motilimonas sp. E26]MCE0558551.1 sugar transferase [Motilimonas sp. E26]